MGLVLAETKGGILANPAIVGFIGVIVGSVLTGLLNFFAQRSADQRRH